MMAFIDSLVSSQASIEKHLDSYEDITVALADERARGDRLAVNSLQVDRAHLRVTLAAAIADAQALLVADDERR